MTTGFKQYVLCDIDRPYFDESVTGGNTAKLKIGRQLQRNIVRLPVKTTEDSHRVNAMIGDVLKINRPRNRQESSTPLPTDDRQPTAAAAAATDTVEKSLRLYATQYPHHHAKATMILNYFKTNSDVYTLDLEKGLLNINKSPENYDLVQVILAMTAKNGKKPPYRDEGEIRNAMQALVKVGFPSYFITNSKTKQLYASTTPLPKSPAGPKTTAGTVRFTPAPTTAKPKKRAQRFLDFNESYTEPRRQ